MLAYLQKYEKDLLSKQAKIAYFLCPLYPVEKRLADKQLALEELKDEYGYEEPSRERSPADAAASSSALNKKKSSYDDSDDEGEVPNIPPSPPTKKCELDLYIEFGRIEGDDDTFDVIA